jgi:hypothetical protein
MKCCVELEELQFTLARADAGRRLGQKLSSDSWQALNVIAQPQLVRRAEGRHLHFAFTGVIDADGFAVYEELPPSPDDHHG